MKHIPALALLALWAFPLTLPAAVVDIDFSTPAAASSFQYAQIGQHGSNGTGAHNLIEWESGFVRMTSRYYQPVTQVAVVGGSNDAGLWDLANLEGPLAVTASYNYANISSDTANGFVELGLVKNSSGANNYPSYYARVALDTFSLYRHNAFNDFAIVDSYALPTTLSGSGFELLFQAENTTGTEVIVGAQFKQNGNLVASLSYTDAVGYTSGYVAIGGGDALNTGTFRGVEFTGLSSAGFLIPEPGTFGLIGLGTLLMRFYRRQRPR